MKITTQNEVVAPPPIKSVIVELSIKDIKEIKEAYRSLNSTPDPSYSKTFNSLIQYLKGLSL